jgi:hypothetical protein
MFLLKLLLLNAFRHKLRTALTIVGLVVAVSAFGLLRTLIDAGMPASRQIEHAAHPAARCR